jgi:hypothetical protein
MSYKVDFSGIVVPDKAHGVEYKEALTRGRTKGRRQEEWYKRRTADRVFAALDATVQGLKLSGSADSADSADSVGSKTVPVPEHQRSFTVHEVQKLLEPGALGLLHDHQGSRKDFLEWTLSLSCVYAHGINAETDIPKYDLRYVGDRRNSLEPIVRITYGNAAYAQYNREENASLAALLTVMLMIKALEFAHQCSLLGKDTSLYWKVSSPFAAKPSESPLYSKLVECAGSWPKEHHLRFRGIKPVNDIVESLEVAARGFSRTIPAAVFSGIRRVAPTRILEYIPTMTQEEFAFLMTIPGMCVRVDGNDYHGKTTTTGPSPVGPQGPVVIRSDSKLFYHLPVDRDEYERKNVKNAEKLVKSIVRALNELKIDELQIRSGSRWIDAHSGMPLWGSQSFLDGYRERMGAYKKRKEDERKEKERKEEERKEKERRRYQSKENKEKQNKEKQNKENKKKENKKKSDECTIL